MATESSDLLPNYAGRADVDGAIESELIEARIEPRKLPEECRNSHPEMRTIVVGSLHGWSFRRAWHYWVATGPGIEVAAAEKLHDKFGSEVRVDGHCGCPSPRERFKGLACGHYHVDTQRGLTALAEAIRSLVDVGQH